MKKTLVGMPAGIGAIGAVPDAHTGTGCHGDA